MSVQLCVVAQCEEYIRTAAGVSIALAFVSLFAALWLRQFTTKLGPDPTAARSYGRLRVCAYVLLGLWVLLPPVWFFFEFEFLHPLIKSAQDDRDFELARVSHAQELASKIWLALVVSLAAILGIKWPPQS